LNDIPNEIKLFYEAYNDDDYDTIKNMLYEETISSNFNSLDGFIWYVKEYKNVLGKNIEYKLIEVHEPVGDNDWTIYIFKSRYENENYEGYSIDYTYHRDQFTIIQDNDTGKKLIRSFSPPSLDSILK